MGGDGMDNSIIFNRVFTQNSFKNILDDPSHSDIYISVVRRIVDNPSDKNNGQLISEIYSFLSKNYRNEYFYKNTLLNKMLLGVHKPTTTTALTEIPIAKSKADFVLINGKAVVYEIKTALDTFERLETQINDYYKVFDNVAVLTDEKNESSICDLLKSSPVGIYLLTKRNQLHEIRKPISYVDRLSKEEMFKVMNKEEFESLLLRFYHRLPEVPAVHYYKACKKLFYELDIELLYPAFLKELKKRNKIIRERYTDIPYELKSLVYFSKFRQSDYDNLYEFLLQRYEE